MIWQRKFRYKIWSCFFWVADFKICNSLLHKWIIDLERSSLDNAQYVLQEKIEISRVLMELLNTELDWFEKGYPWREKTLIPMILKHVTTSRKKRTWSSGTKVENWKYKIINNRKIMKNKPKELKFSDNIYLFENICSDNHALFSK